MNRLSQCLLLLAIAFPAYAIADERPTFQSLWDQLRSKSDCAPAEYPDLTIVTCKTDLTLWYFTKPIHPAHPGVIKRMVTQSNGTVYVQEQGWSFASDDAQPAFQRWLAQIKELDRKVKDETARRQGKPSDQKTN